MKAWIVHRPEQTATADQLRSWCRDRLLYYKIPVQIEFQSQLQKSYVEKVLRRELI